MGARINRRDLSYDEVMDCRVLGRSQLAAGVVGMGTWRTFDVLPISRRDVGVRTSIVTEALRAGVNLFDSSPMYGDAEEVLGRTLRGRRDPAVVATKVWAPTFEEGRRQIERALVLYGGWVDIYQVHNLVRWQEFLPLLREVRDRKQTRAIGITHYSHSAFAELGRIMEEEDIDSVQLPYNASDDRAASELLPLAERRGIGVIVMSPLGSGSLLRFPPPASDLAWLRAFGIETWAQALLKWVVSDPRVTAVIPATSRPGRMAENAASGNPPYFGQAERERVAWLARNAETSA